MRTQEEILKMIDEIPERMCGGTQPLFLLELSKNLKGRGAVVEIGTCAGKSTIALAFGQMINKGSAIFTIDIAEHPDFIKNIKKSQLGEYVTQIINRSSLVAKNWKEKIELLWIDGDHRYRGALSDFKNWEKYVIPGGKVAFHDYPGLEGSMEIWKVIYKNLFSKPKEWRLVSDRLSGSIIVFEKNAVEYKKISPIQKMKNFLRESVINLFWYFEEFYWRSYGGRKTPEQISAGMEKILKPLHFISLKVFGNNETAKK